MESESVSNLLLLLVVISWYAKIWLHFRYLKAVKAELNGSSLLLFLTTITNFFQILIVVMPFFVAAEKSNSQAGGVEKRNVWISVLFLWVSLGFAFTYIYKHPASHEVKKIEYDFTKSPE
jgi:hypothetical protein